MDIFRKKGVCVGGWNYRPNYCRQLLKLHLKCLTNNISMLQSQDLTSCEANDLNILARSTVSLKVNIYHYF